jgi:hypothetical protein
MARSSRRAPRKITEQDLRGIIEQELSEAPARTIASKNRTTEFGAKRQERQLMAVADLLASHLASAIDGVLVSAAAEEAADDIEAEMRTGRLTKEDLGHALEGDRLSAAAARVWRHRYAGALERKLQELCAELKAELAYD